jgi:Ser/Thr protein kinase RdoA (MazF antagonist)
MDDIDDTAAVAATFAPAAQAALAAFPIEPDGLELVAMAENVTWRVTDRRDGTPWVLKLHRPWYHTLDELISERVWVRALADAGVAVPLPLRTCTGEEFVSVVVPQTGERRLAGMTRWTDGRIMAAAVREGADPQTVETWFEQLGGVAACMHEQASRWQAPAGFTRPALDADGFMGNAPHWGPFWEHPSLTSGERQLFLDTRRRLATILERMSRDPSVYSVIHADLHPGNILIDGGRLTVIDFDDAAWGWHAYDMAVVLVNYQDGPHLETFERAYLDSYRSVRPIAAEVLALLPLFRLIRGLAQIGWYHQRPEIRPSRLDELKALTLEQCAALGRSL